MGFAWMKKPCRPVGRVSHRSLFDDSLQGFIHRELPVLGFQGHPEASPGPHDIINLFDQFIKMIKRQPVNA